MKFIYKIQKIIRQVSSGLEYIHSKNIIHQGIILENIAITFNKYPNEVIKGQMPQKVEYSKITFNDSFTLKIGNMKYSKDLKMLNLIILILITLKIWLQDCYLIKVIIIK